MSSPRNAAEAAAPLHHPAGGRRKGTANRAWRIVSASGPSYLEEVGKHSIMRRTGLPPRDLRVLDPLLSYPSTILGRERAIVINLEHIKAIITATEVLVANSKDPVVAAFVNELQSRVAGSPRDPRQAVEFDELDAEVMAKAVPSDLSSPDHNGTNSYGRKNSKKQVKLTSSLNHGTPEDSTMPMPDIHKDGGIKVLPFEFKALEVCLESACKSLENEALTLDQRAYPALDQLTTKVSTLNLERVRQIKSNLVAISGRVQKVRDELEHLLDDDMDMAEMYLTEKLARQPAGETSSRIDVDNDEIDLDDDRYDDLKNEMESNHGSLTGFKPNIEELEMLLEAYFVQIDGTLNKLSTLREYVDDTEDYINIMLDDKQNQLLQMGVMLSTATLVITAGVVVVGIFGMNITIDLYNAPFITFWETTCGTIGGCIVVYILAIGWGKKSGCCSDDYFFELRLQALFERLDLVPVYQELVVQDTFGQKQNEVSAYRKSVKLL